MTYALAECCHHARMTEIQYVLSQRQRLLYLVIGGVMAAVGALDVAVGGSSTFLIVGIVIAAYYFIFGLFSATLRPDGIELRGLTRQRVEWQRIQGIETSNVLGTTTVKLRLVGGGSKRLRAPVRGFGQPDPEFDAKLATIHQWWQHYAGQPAAGR
jgi:hypothetical protein